MKGIIAFFGSLLFMYLLGSFVANDFNTANWTIQGRAFLAIMGTVISAMFAVAVSE